MVNLLSNLKQDKQQMTAKCCHSRHLIHSMNNLFMNEFENKTLNRFWINQYEKESMILKIETSTAKELPLFSASSNMDLSSCFSDKV